MGIIKKKSGRGLIAAGAVGLTATGIGVVLVSGSMDPEAAPQSGTETVQVDSAGMKVAPEPDDEFRDQECAAPNVDAPNMEPSMVSAPETGIETLVHPSDDLSLPDAPDGMIDTQSAPLGASEGHTVTAGHVDYAPGVLSEQGGELSPWGHAHELQACDSVFASDENGNVYHYQVTDKFVVDQNELENSGTFDQDGPHSLVMVTCSGKSVEDAGREFQFNYEHNLIIIAEQVNP